MEFQNEAKRVFSQHANAVDANGEPYLTVDTFIDAVAPAEAESFKKIGRNSYGVLFEVADRNSKGRVTLSDWLWFDSILDRPDAEFQVAFRLFDRDERGVVNFRDFVDLYTQNRSDSTLNFDWNGKWAALYIGDLENRHQMSYMQFCQMLMGLSGERVRQYFQHLDKSKCGFITPEDFALIVKSVARHKLSDHLLDNVHSVVNRPSSQYSLVSYATVRAFFNVINRVEIVEQIAKAAADETGHFTRANFTEEAAKTLKWGFFTPLEIDLLFHFAGVTRTGDVATLDSFEMMFDPTWRDKESLYRESSIKKSQAAKNFGHDPKSFISEVFESAYNFALGSVAGALGATVVYPIDLVKTRMQNQRKTAPGTQLLYANSIDCFKKVIKKEGFRGLYSGLGPQLVGVAPEKAIKLTVNDLVRGILADSDGNISGLAEVIAGGSAGACQVVFTNPLEIVKIRLQVQGELAANAVGHVKQSAVHIVRQLGLVGLYKGASACLLRDVPFSAIYFPSYAHLKKDLFKEGPSKRLNAWELLTAGAIAGIPAAYLTTPCDVIKTRLQVEARKGETSYSGLRHAATTIWKEEGFAAFFKGGPARIFRSSPQFGCTLAAYEVLKRLLPFPGSSKDTSEAGHSVPTAERQNQALNVKYLRSRNSLKLLLDIDENFGKPRVPPTLLKNN
uniref:Mitochondrial aspartate-glutamate transporter AGC1 n=1 Tax=Starmerella bombicola TaxID=75736 RepID=A0A6M8Y3K8_STABO|nr:mitochondrial Agc1 [Starmerella bombicola]